MTVEPGFGGQSFMEDMLEKITQARDFITVNNLNIRIQADGGINFKTIENAVNAGADVLVAGSVVYGSEDPAQAIRQLRNLIKVD
jgi:ribulose-phosphate 3-epimerase